MNLKYLALLLVFIQVAYTQTTLVRYVARVQGLNPLSIRYIDANGNVGEASEAPQWEKTVVLDPTIKEVAISASATYRPNDTVAAEILVVTLSQKQLVRYVELMRSKINKSKVLEVMTFEMASEESEKIWADFRKEMDELEKKILGGLRLVASQTALERVAVTYKIK